MSSRKRPQQQLASYFNELLTELDEPDVDTRSATLKDTKPLATDKPKNSSTFKADAISSNNFTASSVEPSSKKHSQKVSKLAPATFANEESSLSSKPVRDKDENLEKLQQEKLQRLLRSLSPNVGTLESSAQKTIEENFLLTDTQTKIETFVEEQAVSSAPHQWQPLSDKWLDNGKPAWAQERFDILLVNVSGVNLAVPLEALDAIYPIENELTTLFGQEEWFLGLQKTAVGNIKVINTTQFIMPERYKGHEASAAQYSVAINGSGWGIAVDTINQPIAIDPEDVRWRVNRSQRPWVAGMVKEHMCVLLDIPLLAKILTEKDQNKRIKTGVDDKLNYSK